MIVYRKRISWKHRCMKIIQLQKGSQLLDCMLSRTHATRSFIMILKSLYFCPRFWGNLVLPDFARYNQHKISALTSNKSTQFSWLQNLLFRIQKWSSGQLRFRNEQETCRSVCLSSVYDLQGDVSILSEMGIVKDYVDTGYSSWDRRKNLWCLCHITACFCSSIVHIFTWIYADCSSHEFI